MNFEDEDYRRLYVRRTVTSKRLGWEGRAVRNEMLTEFDRAGIWEFTDDAAADIAELVELPIEVARVGLARLIATKTWVLSEGKIIWTRHVEAQTCARSDRIRQQESRDRRREQALTEAKNSQVDQSRHEPSRASQTVTPPSLAIPPSLDLSLSTEQAEPPTHIRVPEGWNAPEGLFAEAFAAGVTRAGLEEAVRYWRGRKLGGEWFSIEDFFRGKFASIKIREEKARFAEQQERSGAKGGLRKAEPDVTTTAAATAFRPSTEHVKFCAEKNLDLAFAVQRYRQSPEHDRVGFAESERRFLARLKCWAATGTFHADGPLPKSKRSPGNSAGGKEAA